MFLNLTRPFLRWWVLFCYSLGLLIIPSFFGFYKYMYINDVSKLSFVILIVYLITSIWMGFKTHNYFKHTGISRKENNNIELGWYIADQMVNVGYIGTVIGMAILLSSIVSVDLANALVAQKALSGIAIGIGTALLTTLAGLVCSHLLKNQLFSFEQADLSETSK